MFRLFVQKIRLNETVVIDWFLRQVKIADTTRYIAEQISVWDIEAWLKFFIYKVSGSNINFSFEFRAVFLVEKIEGFQHPELFIFHKSI